MASLPSHEQGHSLPAAAVVLARVLDAWRGSLSDFQQHLTRTDHPMDGDSIEAAWQPVATLHRAVEAEFACLAEVVEDQLDLIDALAARQEPGEPIPWEALKVELGLP